MLYWTGAKFCMSEILWPPTWHVKHHLGNTKHDDIVSHYYTFGRHYNGWQNVLSNLYHNSTEYCNFNVKGKRRSHLCFPVDIFTFGLSDCYQSATSSMLGWIFPPISTTFTIRERPLFCALFTIRTTFGFILTHPPTVQFEHTGQLNAHTLKDTFVCREY